MLNFTDIQSAAARLKGVAHRAPILTSTTLNRMLGCEMFMKAENFQRMGAFKFRGGYNAINALTNAERARGVLAFSSGNHAQAVALAAQLHGCKAANLMPADAPQMKLDAIRIAPVTSGNAMPIITARNQRTHEHPNRHCKLHN